MRNVDDTGRLFDSFLKGQGTVGAREIELLELSLCSLSSLAGRRTVVALDDVSPGSPDIFEDNLPSTGHSARSCRGQGRPS